MNRRIAKVRQYSSNLDMLGLQETHSTPERALALESEFRQHAFFWSHCSLQKGGVALGISHEFMSRFSKASWTEIEQGRVGKLELRGSQGSLDLFCVYLDDQSSASRRNSFDLINKFLAPPSEVLSLMFGDFNFVEHAHDRTCKTSGQSTGSRDSMDAKLFAERVLQKGKLFEIEQEHHTFEGGRALSKLDRVYANWHACDQLDHTIECVAGTWPHRISDHRPVFFARRVAKRNYTCLGVEKPLPAWTLEHESWPAMVKEVHLDLMVSQNSHYSF